MFKCCRTWLLLVSVLFIVFGLFMAIGNQTAIFKQLFSAHIDPVFWSQSPLSPETVDFQKWIYGVLGATCAGWGTMIGYMVFFSLKLRQKRLWQSLLVSITFWLVVDTFISWQMRVYFNVMFNLLLFVSAMVPLFLIRKEFRNA